MITLFFVLISVVIALLLNPASGAPAGSGYENDDSVQCFEYTVSVRNTGQKLQDPDVTRYILAKKDKAVVHPEWVQSNNVEECKKAILL